MIPANLLAPRPRQQSFLAEVNLHFLCVRTVAFYNDLSWHLLPPFYILFLFLSVLKLRLASPCVWLYLSTLFTSTL